MDAGFGERCWEGAGSSYMRTQPSHKVTNSMSTPRGLGILPWPTELGAKKLLLVIFQNGSKDLQPHSPQWHSHHLHQKEMPKIITSPPPQKKKNTWKFKKAFLLNLWIIMGGVKNWLGTHLYPCLVPSFYQGMSKMVFKPQSNFQTMSYLLRMTMTSKCHCHFCLIQSIHCGHWKPLLTNMTK